MLKKNIVIVFLILAFQISSAQDTLFLNLNQALEMAVEQNQLIKIFQYKIANADGKLKEMNSHFYPRIIAEGTFAYNSDPNIYAKKGEFNHFYDDLIGVEWIDELLEKYFPLPPRDMTLIKGDNFFSKANVGVYQPLSQLTTINTGNKIAGIDLKISNLELNDVISKVKLGVNELFYGILIEEKNEEVAKYNLEYKILQYQETKNAYESGEVLIIDVTALKAEIYEKELELLEIQNKKESYIYTFNNILGLDIDTKTKLLFDTIDLKPYNNIQEYYSMAFSNNYELGISNATIDKAKLGITAAKKAYIPELSYFAQYNDNRGLPLYPENYFLTGLNLKWTLIASGERSALIKQRNALFNEASENFEYKRKYLRVEVHKAYLDLTYAYKLIQTAKKALEVRNEELILTVNLVDEGEALPSMLLKAKADYAKAQADLLASELNYLISFAKLNRLTGDQ